MRTSVIILNHGLNGINTQTLSLRFKRFAARLSLVQMHTVSQSACFAAADRTIGKVLEITSYV